MRDEPGSHLEAKTAEAARDEIRGVRADGRLGWNSGAHADVTAVADDDFADVLALREEAERFGHPAHFEFGARRRLDGARGNVLGDFAHQFANKFRALEREPVEIHGEEREVAAEGREIQAVATVDIGLAELDEAAVGREASHTALECFARERVQDDVDAAAAGALADLVG